MERQDKSLEVCKTWPEPACESQLHAGPSNSASSEVMLVVKTSCLYCKSTNATKSGLLFCPGEPIPPGYHWKQPYKIQHKETKRSQMHERGQICEEYMRNSNIYLTGVSKETEEIKEQENGKVTSDEKMGTIFPELMKSQV